MLLFLFYRVLYFSIHRYELGEFWPNLRESDYDAIGEGGAQGYNINIPLNEVGGTHYRADSSYHWMRWVARTIGQTVGTTEWGGWHAL